MAEQIEVQWGVDMGFALVPLPTEDEAQRWVQSYRDHPEAVTEGDPMPTVVRRTVTTTAWEPTAEPTTDPTPGVTRRATEEDE